MFSSRILDWNLDNLLSIINEMSNSIEKSDFNSLSTQKSIEFSLIIEFNS